MNWTKEQSDAIYKKNSNILVAAAAGSGKTAVLVERIIQKIIKDKIDIDKLLVVTFTNAAASEMRERILDAIYKKLDENSEDEHLQKQIVLLSKSNICTIDSFCLEIVRNNFFEINFPANFRIASGEELELLKQEVLEDTFDKLYEEENSKFLKLVECYADYRGDDDLKELVLKIYNYIQSTPFPKEWLDEKVQMFKSDTSIDFSKSVWGQILLDDVREELTSNIDILKKLKQNLDMYPELEKFSSTLEIDIEKLEKLYNLSFEGWDKIYEQKNLLSIKDNKWPRESKIINELKDKTHEIRTTIMKRLSDNVNKKIICSSEEAYQDFNEMYEILSNLKDTIFKFDEEFKAKKKEKNIMDFGDIEHFALNILLKKNEDGKYVETDVAKKYREKFEEIAIDEYQDSNEVQEYILSTISRGNNIFMVGDVKQSVYKFRQACPKLFLDKYENYSKEGNEKGLKIQLFKNFRSKENIINITNLIFKEIMSKELGDNIDYTEEEYLNLGADFEKVENELTKSEIDLVELEDLEEDESDEETDSENSLEKMRLQLEKEEVEAKLIAKKIKELISSKYQIKDKKDGIRNIKYRDIAILLRSTKSASIYEKELINNNIPVFSDSSDEYLDTIEIQTILNLLRVLDNPIDDISLVSVLRSEIGGFTDNEILEIRFFDREKNYYYSMIKASENAEEKLKEKVISFLEKLKNWKLESEYLGISELIWKIYIDTGYYNYVGLMPNGSLRQANLKMLFERAKEYERTSFKGLFNFIKFFEKIKLGNSDMSSAKIIGENENVVRIMSIHKSKGLEFPIVFLSAVWKKFNDEDLKKSILLHQDLGLGPEYINYERKIRYSTLARETLKIAIKNEAIAEEMRVLYVALTRAKEKLIITGVIKDVEKRKNKIKEDLNTYLKNEKIPSFVLKKHNTYLDWILLCLIKNEALNKELKENIYKKSDLINFQIEENHKEENIKELKCDENENFEEIDKIFNWKYKYDSLIDLPIKTTVSKIKEQANISEEKIDFDDLINKKEIGIANIVPTFMEEEQAFTGAKKGTITHLFLQKLDFKEKYNIEKINNLKEELIYKKILSKEEADIVDTNKILLFTESKFYEKISKFKVIEKEKPFCIKVSASEIGKNKEDEILVQGIIDLYAIDENDNIMLVDYKTDFVEEEAKLVEKYKKQLQIYKMALEEALNKKVNEVYIYSLYLNKEIVINV